MEKVTFVKTEYVTVAETLECFVLFCFSKLKRHQVTATSEFFFQGS